MKDKCHSKCPSFRNVSQQRNIECLKEQRKKLPKETVGLFIVLFISLVYALLKFSAHSQSLSKIHSIPILFTGSLAVANGDHLRYCTVLLM